MRKTADKNAVVEPAMRAGDKPSPEDVAVSTATLIVADALFPDLAPVLIRHRTIRLLGTGAPGLDLVSASSKLRPDVLLLPAGTEEASLRVLLQQMRLHAHETRTLIVSERTDCEFISMILRHGARGCLRPGASPDDLRKAVLAVKQGDVWLERRALADALSYLFRAQDPSTACAKTSPTEPCDSLTERENEIGALLAQGLTNKEIAKRLSVSCETIKKHLKQLFIKLGVHRRAQVVLRRFG